MLIDEDQSLIKREHLIPGFQFLLNSARLSSLIETRCGISALEDLRLDYLRYKPGTNCIARFQYKADGEWSVGYAKAFGPDATVKLQKSLEQPSCPGKIGMADTYWRRSRYSFAFFQTIASLALSPDWRSHRCVRNCYPEFSSRKTAGRKRHSRR